MLTQTGFIIANKMTTAANAIMLQYASPLFVVIFGAIFYHYRPTRRETTALGIAFSGHHLVLSRRFIPWQPGGQSDRHRHGCDLWSGFSIEQPAGM